ncbi:unnamed protein product [Schistosoma rodhaini]|nr:unnamed protein product [Schistosoma rodhaini]
MNEIQMNVFRRKCAVDDLTEDLKIPFMDYVTNVMDHRSGEKLIQLLKGLEHHTAESKFPTDSKRYVHNFSDVELDDDKLEVLSLGLKFCDTRNSCNHIDTDIQFENLYSQTRDLVANSDQQLEHFESTLVDCCYQYKNNKFNYKSIPTKRHKEAINVLLKDETLLITKGDKGSRVVLLNKNDYIDKMGTILNDKLKFQKITDHKDLNMKIEKELTSSLKKLRDNQTISSGLYEIIKPVL